VVGFLVSGLHKAKSTVKGHVKGEDQRAKIKGEDQGRRSKAKSKAKIKGRRSRAKIKGLKSKPDAWGLGRGKFLATLLRKVARKFAQRPRRLLPGTEILLVRGAAARLAGLTRSWAFWLAFQG
jgi:hypothetical protein